MVLPVDADILIFLVTTFTVIFASKGRLLQNVRQIPAHYDFEELTDNRLTEAQRNYLRPIDAQLGKLNYRPDCTFRVRNYGQNLLRRYSNPADPATCGVTIVEVKTKVGQAQTVRNANSVEFTSRFADGRTLNTRNSPLKSLMDQPPYKIVQQFPNLTDLAELKRKHAAASNSLGVPLTAPSGAAAIFEEVQKDHTRFSEFQVEHGVYRKSPGGDAYQITEKVMNRGIRNFFNPFAKRFSATQAIFSVLLGAFLPLFGILKIAPVIATSQYQHALAFYSESTIAIALCYVLTGAILGYACNAESFVWVMLITYLPAHLIAGASLGWFPFSTLAFYISRSVAQAKQRKQLVLQS